RGGRDGRTVRLPARSRLRRRAGLLLLAAGGCVDGPRPAGTRRQLVIAPSSEQPAEEDARRIGGVAGVGDREIREEGRSVPGETFVVAQEVTLRERRRPQIERPGQRSLLPGGTLIGGDSDPGAGEEVRGIAPIVVARVVIGDCDATAAGRNRGRERLRRRDAVHLYRRCRPALAAVQRAGERDAIVVAAAELRTFPDHMDGSRRGINRDGRE